MKDKVYITNIGIALMFGIGLLPPLGPVTPVGMQVAGVFLGLLYLWSTVEIIWPSILGVIALGMTKYTSIPTVLKDGMGNSVIWQLVMIMILAQALTDSGVGEHLARWMITRNFVKGRPMLFTMVFFLSFFLPAMCLGSLPVTLLGWSIIRNISDEAGYRTGERYRSLMEVGMFILAAAGSGCLPFRGWRFALTEAYNNAAGVDISIMLYIGITFIIGIIFLVTYVLFMKFVFRADFSKLALIDTELLKNRNQERLNQKQKMCAAGFIGVIVFVVVSSLVPSGTAAGIWMNQVGTAGSFSIAVVLLCMVRIQGEPVIDFKQTARVGIRWETLLICAVAIPAAAALTDESTGIPVMLTTVFGHLFNGHGAVFFIACTAIAILTLTNIGSNTGMGLLLIPIVLPFVKPLHVKPEIVGIAIVFLSNLAFMQPGASATAGLLFANRNITTREIYLYGGCSMMLLMLISTAVLVIYNYWCPLNLGAICT